MVPFDLEGRSVTLAPPADGHRIVIMTGSALRHRRFALRLQQEFGDRVVAWYEFGSQAGLGRRQRLREVVEDIGRSALRNRGLRRFSQPLRRLAETWALRRFYKQYPLAERRILAEEVRLLERFACIRPTPVAPACLRDPAWIESIRSLRGYFLLSLGGPLYPASVLRCFSGACINQHAGHSPEYRGNYTTEWAAFHRQYDMMSVTVHLTVPEADAGPILRRSEPCLAPGDTIADAFCRVVTLGTELMVDAVHEAISTGRMRVFEQPRIGREYLSANFCAEVALAVSDDFRRGRHEWFLDRMRQF